jgi:ATP-dependent RNA helicase DeaD
MNTIESAFAGIPSPLRAAIERRGFTSPTAVQQAVLSADTVGRSLRISSQTGSGKTLALGLVLADAFVPAEGATTLTQAPSAVRGPTALIITPTRELATQVRDELQWLFEDVRGLQVGVVTGGTDRVAERKLLARRPGIVVGTPGRLLDHIRHGALRCHDVAHVVLDEADRMLDMGFREELEAIIETLPEERCSHLVSATFPRHVKLLADRFQCDAIHLQGTALGVANGDIEHVAHLVADGGAYPALVNQLLLASGERVLVFVERRTDAANLAQRLADDGFAAQPFSGELSQAQRSRSLDAFRRGSIDILVSTDVAARGIDVPDISLVVHATPPSDADCYTHRSGRTGRAGSKGRSLLLVSVRARRHIERLLAGARVEVDWQPAPTPGRVRKALTKRLRRKLHARLDAEPSNLDKHAEYAALLLRERDPVAVVSALLEMAELPPAREPMEVREPAPPREGTSARPTPRDPSGDRPGRRPRTRMGGPSRYRHGRDEHQERRRT